jgi:hypothetical protein
MTGAAEVLARAINALQPYGPTPIVTVALGGLALGALSVGAPPFATVALVVICFGTYLWGQERKAVWARRELAAIYDGEERRDTYEARLNLERRMQLPRNQRQSSLGSEQGVG